MNCLAGASLAVRAMHLALCWFAGAALVAKVEGAAAYTVTDLGNTYVIHGYQSKVINYLGEVIGNDPESNGVAALFTGGSWHVLGKLNQSGSGPTLTEAHGLNNSSMVVGASDTGASTAGSDQTDGFYVIGPGGTFTGLGLVTTANPAEKAIAYACNRQGDIVGNVINNSAGTLDTFIYRAGSGLVSRRSDNVYSFAINRFGDVLGTLPGLPPQPVINGAVLPGALASYTPHALNDAGQILLSGDNTHPLAAGWGVIYDYSTGKTTTLPNLKPNSTGFTAFLDLNDLGEVVGRGSDESGNGHAVLYTPAMGLVSLDALGLTAGGNPITLTEAQGINNAGQIVCLGFTGNATEIRGYLLTPVTAPALPLAAAYDGLATLNGVDFGLVVITVDKMGFASVKLTAPGVNDGFKAPLTNGAFTGSVTVKGASLNVNLLADSARQSISGSIGVGNSTYSVLALRRSNLGIFAGTYTALLQLPSPSMNQPQGVGYGQMKISKTGGVTVKGQLGDGTPFSVAGSMHFDGSWTFYTPLYLKAAQPGSIAGNVNFSRTAKDSDCAGTLTWRNPGSFGTLQVPFQAALLKTGKNVPLLTFGGQPSGAATFHLTGGDQALADKTLSIDAKDAVTVTSPNPDPDGLKVTLSPASGALGGSFIHPVTKKKVNFTGVVQQKLNLGGGVFPGPTTEGGVLLTPK